MELATVLPIALPIVLFVITLIIIFGLRGSDKNTRSLANTKRLVEQIETDVAKADSNFKQEIAEIEAQIGQKEDQVRSLIQTSTTHINTLDSYNDDFGRLGASMQSYRTALAGLQRLTDATRDDVESVKAEVARLEEVRAMIDSFRSDMQEAERELTEHERRVIILERETSDRLKTLAAQLKEESSQNLEAFRNDIEMQVDGRIEQVESALSRMTASVESYMNELDQRITATRDATESLNERSLSILGNMGDRAKEQQLLSAQLEELEERKLTLKGDIANLEREINQKSRTVDELTGRAADEIKHLEELKKENASLEARDSELRQSITDATEEKLAAEEAARKAQEEAFASLEEAKQAEKKAREAKNAALEAELQADWLEKPAAPAEPGAEDESQAPQEADFEIQDMNLDVEPEKKEEKRTYSIGPVPLGHSSENEEITFD